MRNRYAAICYRCGKMVEVGQGHFQKSQKNIKVRFASKWLTQHAECARKYFGTDHCYIIKAESFTDD
jgi:uncharacterized UPF0146 family protein